MFTRGLRGNRVQGTLVLSEVGLQLPGVLSTHTTFPVSSPGTRREDRVVGGERVREVGGVRGSTVSMRRDPERLEVMGDLRFLYKRI